MLSKGTMLCRFSHCVAEVASYHPPVCNFEFLMIIYKFINFKITSL